VVDVSTPVTSLDERYSSSEATAFSWSDTQRELEKAEIFWLTTVRADGRPHVTPLVAVWWNGALHFTTGDKEQKYANLRTNSHVALTTGCNDWREGVDIVVEGDARQGADQRELEDLSAVFLAKWDGDSWGYEARDGKFFHPGGFEVQLFSVRPRTVYAFAKGTFGHTVHRFEEE
jgi:general stress protein 26